MLLFDFSPAFINMKKLATIFVFVAAAAALALFASGCSARGLQLNLIKLPPGFHISVYADHVPGARSLVMSPSGTLFVGSREDRGSVYAIPKPSGEGRAEVITIASNLFMPNGVEFRQGALYVGEVNRILRFDKIESDLRHPPAPVMVTNKLPSKLHHGWKYIRFGPDDLLYVPVGAPCNICNPGDPFAAMLRMKPDGSDMEVFARGIRNTVGFDWHPVTKQLWFTDNGRDWLGDNSPPDELNCAPHAGMHFGYPYCHGKNILDPQFGDHHKCEEFTPPVVELGPHVASLGMRFYTGKMFPGEYRNQIFICEHGSWNRTIPIGYRLSLVRFIDGKPKYETFAAGWLQGMEAWGRPVDVLVAPDGALLVSDDKAGCIYRISYGDK